MKEKKQLKKIPFKTKNEYTFQDIFNAYLNCRKNKLSSRSFLEFEPNYEEKLFQLLNDINNRNYEISQMNVFSIKYPKPREIWASQFRDRIVHHLLYDHMHEYFEKQYIAQSYSCIKKRGNFKAIEDAYKGMISISNNFSKNAYFIKLDIDNFFISINKEILWNIIKEKLDDENSLTAYLIKKVIFTNVTKNPNIYHNSPLYLIPEHKSLLNTNNDKYGLPIGNLTSQFFSNIYLDGLDKFCKHKLKIKYYYRYADDILILEKNLSRKTYLIQEIRKWLKENRELSISNDKIKIQPFKNGMKFLSVKLFPYRKVSKRITISKFIKCVKRFKRSIFNDKLLCGINSYNGLLFHYNNFNLRKKLLNGLIVPFNIIVDKYFYIKRI